MHRRRDSSARLPSSMPSSPMSLSMSFPIHTASILNVGTLATRKRRPRRSTCIAVLALLAVSAYIALYIIRPALGLAPMSLRGASASAADLLESSPRQPPAPPAAADKPHARSRKMKQAPVAAPAAHSAVALTAAQELAAITSFLASLAENVIPAAVDPAAPIDPSLVLDFDVHGARAEKELAGMVEDVWARNPVVLFAKTHSASSRTLKALLAGLQLSPPPTVFNVDTRADAAVLTPLLTRLTASDLPVLLVGGKPLGGAVQVEALAKEGALTKLVAEAGAVVGGGKKMKKSRK
ncbi:hypothetical protein HWV62_43575 [Athelia sp. TMB]|nr:hypothetical protein HWV62_24229 [Athelia sp. TMB]KAF7979076.1 hypothetical protein HWV62_43575 [Athelia sp. TMB]